MSLPIPEPGLVISFNYLWARERGQGVEHGRYARPCAIVVTYRRRSDEDLIVTVVPVTHQPPRDGDAAIPIPLPIKRCLGLDDDPSWVIVDEVNEFAWPGFDLEPNAEGRIDYGSIPPRFYARIREAVLELARARRLKRTPR